MDNQIKIQELEERIAKLEKAENKRIRKKRITIIIKIIYLLIIIILIILGYSYLNNKIIKPYQNKVDYVNEKVNNVEELIKDKWNSLQKYNPFN